LLDWADEPEAPRTVRKLSQDFVDHCPEERGFRLRGLQTTRIETFVDAAFAFAVTMLVISFDEIPANFDEMVTALKSTPAFIAAVAQLMWIWHAHNTWSRRFGLEDTMTVFLSSSLVIVVLVYVYPLRILAQGAFSWLTNQWLPAPFDINAWYELRFMFVILGIGFVALCLIFRWMNAYADRHWQALRLDDVERHHVRTSVIVWSASAGIGLLPIVLALLLPDQLVPLAGFGFAPLGVVLPIIEFGRWKRVPES